MKAKICNFSEADLASSRPIVVQIGQAPQEIQWVSKLTDIIQALENFQDFEPAVRATAIALYASELGVSQLHFYAIALHTGLGGVQ